MLWPEIHPLLFHLSKASGDRLVIQYLKYADYADMLGYDQVPYGSSVNVLGPQPPAPLDWACLDGTSIAKLTIAVVDWDA